MQYIIGGHPLCTGAVGLYTDVTYVFPRGMAWVGAFKLLYFVIEN